MLSDKDKIGRFSIFKRSYSIIFVPEDDSRSFTLNLPQKFLNSLFFVIFLAILIFLISSIFTYYNLSRKDDAIALLKKENKDLKVRNGIISPQMNYYQHRTRQLSQEIHRERKQYAEALHILIDRLKEIERYCINLRIVAGFKISTEEGKFLNGEWKKENWSKKINFASNHDYTIENLEILDVYIDDYLTSQKKEINQLTGALAHKKTILIDTPNCCPLKNTYIYSDFGYREVSWGRVFHKGIDLPAGFKTPIYSPADGVVITVGKERGYGLYMIIKHSDTYTTRYAHLAGFAVRIGDRIARGDVIAYVGNTGRSTGNHLHYEVRKNGNPVDPKGFLSKKLKIKLTD